MRCGWLRSHSYIPVLVWTYTHAVNSEMQSVYPLILQKRFLYAPFNTLYQSQSNQLTKPQTEENQSELRTYDDKVYRASVQMADAMTLELRGLGIPFFALRRGVVRDGSENGDGDKVGVGVGVGKQILNKDDLRILQRRVLELLQDLCRE